MMYDRYYYKRYRNFISFEKDNFSLKKKMVKSIRLINLFDLLDSQPNLFEEDLLSMDDKIELLSEDFDRFSKFIQVSKMSKNSLVKIFVCQPSAIMKSKLLNLNDLSKTHLTFIAKTEPKLFVDYCLPMKTISAEAWVCLLNSGTFTVKSFLKNTASLPNAKEIKLILTLKPDLIKALTVPAIENFKIEPEKIAYYLEKSDMLGSLKPEVFEYYVNHRTILKLQGNLTSKMDKRFKALDSIEVKDID